LRALNHAAGFVQSRLADRMKTRFLPVLTFVLDEGVKNSIEVNRLLAEARALEGKADTTEQKDSGQIEGADETPG
jgi:ribosome-binding factor A